MKNFSGSARGFVVVMVVVLLVGFCRGSANSETQKKEYYTNVILGEQFNQKSWDIASELFAGEKAVIPMVMELKSYSPGKVSMPYKISLYRLSREQTIDISRSDDHKYLHKLINDKNLILFKSQESILEFNQLKEIDKSGYWDFEKNSPGINKNIHSDLPKKEYTQSIQIKPDFGKLIPGFYMFYMEFGNDKAMHVLHVSRAAMIVKSSEDETLVFTQDKKTGEPIPDMDISIQTGNDFKAIGKTDANGILKFRKPDLPMISDERQNVKSFITAIKDDDIALCKMDIKKYPPDFMAYIYTDRPVYRPGQTVHFKGILRENKGNIMKLLTGKDVEVSVFKEREGEIYKKILSPNEYGNISGDIELEKDVRSGRYLIQIKHKSQYQIGYFFVEEYRKPEYLISVKPFKQFIIRGEKAKFEIDAKYIFGEPVKNSEFIYEIKEGYLNEKKYTNIDYNVLGWFEQYSENVNPDDEISKERSNVNPGTNFKGKTDENGKATIEINTNRIQGKIYTLKATVMDSSNRPVSGAGSVITLAGNFKIDVITDRTFYTSGNPIPISVKTLDFSGRPVSKTVNLEIVQPVKFRKKDGKYGYKKSIIFSKIFETDNEGKYTFLFSPGKNKGYFQIFAGSKDYLGNSIWGFEEFNITGKTDRHYFHNKYKLIVDKSIHKIGEDIDIMFSMSDEDKSYENVWCLVTIETDKIAKYKVLKCNELLNVISFTAEKEFYPKASLSLVFWKNNDIHFFHKEIRVNSNEGLIKVLLDGNKNKLRPNDIVTYKIKTIKESDEVPKSCEISLGVADESVFGLVENLSIDIQKFFYGEIEYGNPYRVYRNNSKRVKMYFSKLFLFSSDIPDLITWVPGTFPPRVDDKTIRQYFPDTCYFNPHIITDENGEATVHVKLPDSLTTWRATAVANSKDSEFGQAEEKVTVSKNLLVRLITPRFLVEKDEAAIMGIVHNYLDKAVETEVSLEAEGVELLSPKTVKVEIQPGKKADAVWNVRAVKPGEAKFTVKALTSEESDAVLMKIPLLAHGSKVTETKAGSTEDSLTLTFRLPEGASKESAVLRLNLAPSLAGTLMDALEYLAAYPYGCIEQTMNRFIPNAVVQASLKEFGIRNGELEKKLPDMMKEGFKKIYDYQHKDGGWGWWKNDSTKPLMTALVVYGLSLADKAGYDVDRAKILNGSFMLKNQLMKITDPNQRAFILFALSEADVKMNYFVNRLFEKRDKLDNYSQALLAITLYKHDEKEKAKIILESLEKTAKAHETYAYWEGDGAGSWSDNPVETTAYAVQAFILIDPENPILEKAVRYLTLSRRGRCWHSTKDTAAAVLAVMEYAKMTKEMDPEFDAILYLNGRKLKDIKFTKNDIASGGMFVNVKGDDLKTGENTVTVEKSGRGRAYLTGTLTSYLETERAKAYAKGFTVKRKYYLVTKKTEKEINAENKRRERKGNYDRYGSYGGYNSNPEEKLIPLDEKGLITLNPQDVVEVSLYVVGEKGMEYIMIEDMKPAGFEFIKDDKYGRYWYGVREFRDDRAVFFIGWMWRKSENIRYRMRAETPGTFHALPARTELMYYPDVRGESDEFIVEVKDDKEQVKGNRTLMEAD